MENLLNDKIGQETSRDGLELELALAYLRSAYAAAFPSLKPLSYKLSETALISKKPKKRESGILVLSGHL